MRQKTTATFEKRRGDGVCLGIAWGFILNEAQWLNFPSFVAWKTDTSSPLDFLLGAVADESRAGITQLQHSHLQIQGWQGSSASFNYEWQPFISCLLIRWDDAICSHHSLFHFFVLLDTWTQPILVIQISGERNGSGRIILEFKRVKFQVIQRRNHKKKNKLAVYWREWKSVTAPPMESWQLLEHPSW